MTLSSLLFLLPGGMTPAVLSFQALASALGSGVRTVPFDYALFAGGTPPPNWSLAMEAAGLARAADGAGAQSLHLVGYSLGAAVALRFAEAYPARVRSLTLLEPDWIGSAERLSPEDRATREELRAASSEGRMPDAMRASARSVLRPGASMPPPPPAGPPPAWMPSRIAALPIFPQIYDERFEAESLEKVDAPALVILGDGSSERCHRVAQDLVAHLRGARITVVPGTNHLMPAHRERPAEVAEAILRLIGGPTGRAPA